MPDAGSRGRERVRWASTTLPIAPLAGIVYLLLEWLFFVTKPSPLAGLPLKTELVVLVKSPLAILLPLIAVQAGASALSAIFYPTAKWVALVPGAAAGGVLLFVLTDNFTYTLFGFGVLSAGLSVRLIYAALLPVLMVLAGRTLYHWTASLMCRHRATAVALAVAWLLVIAPAADVRTAAPAPDPAAPPTPRAGRAGASTVPNILLLGIDGVDAEITSAYGYPRPTTPFLETLRDQSLFFENAFANVGRTHGSLVSLLTGRLPFATHVTFPPTVLLGEDAHRHLPALLKTMGYSTLQLGMRHYADAEDANLLGFDAANYRWQHIEQVTPGAGPSNETDAFRAAVAERLDERLGQLLGVRHAIDGFAHVEGRQESPYWRDDRKVSTLMRYFSTAAQPWFVHAHLLDTHCCAYQPSHVYFSSGPDPGDDSRDNQIRESDENVRRLFHALESGGQLDRTIVVIYSDHTSSWTTKGRVPLMIRFPGSGPRGSVSANVQLADVAPTVLDYLGVAAPDWMDGVSLLAHERLAPGRPIFGISDVSDRQPVAPFLTALANAHPPNYGATSVTLISGRQWFEMSLLDGSLRVGGVSGHTGLGLPPTTEASGRATLNSWLARARFKVETGDSH